MRAARTSPLLGRRAWAGAIGLAVLLHLPLLWVQIDRHRDDDNEGPVIELLLSPPEPIPVSPPSEWADALELKWTLSEEVPPEATQAQFEPLPGLDGGQMALSAQLTGLAPADNRRSVAAAEPPQSEARPTPPAESLPEAIPEPAPAPARERSRPLETAIDRALAGTPAFRQAPEPDPLPPARDPTPASTTSRDDAGDPVATALAGTPAVRRPQALPPDAQAALEQARQPTASQAAPTTRVQTSPTPEPDRPANTTAPDDGPADTDRRYRPDGPAGAFTANRDAFFSQLAEHLFVVNDARLNAAPYTRRRIVDVRFAIDRAGRVMRVWTPDPVQGPSVEIAKQIIWDASPVPRLAPDMPQSALELTFPVVVGQP